MTGKSIKDNENGLLFYPTNSILNINCTCYNEKGYYNEENYLKLQAKIANKSIVDIYFVNCDLFNLTKTIDLSNCSYVYLSNIMDFLVGIDKESIDREELKKFKCFVLKDLAPSLKENATIDLSFIKSSWHKGLESEYFEEYPIEEGFSINVLLNGRDYVLSFDNSLVVSKNAFKAK